MAGKAAEIPNGVAWVLLMVLMTVAFLLWIHGHRVQEQQKQPQPTISVSATSTK